MSHRVDDFFFFILKHFGEKNIETVDSTESNEFKFTYMHARRYIVKYLHN